jgi:hypothetical protein
MKNLFQLTLCLVFLSVSTVVSAEPPPMGEMPMPNGEGQGMDGPRSGGDGSGHGIGRPPRHDGEDEQAMPGMNAEQRMEHLRSVQEHKLKMHDLSNKILAEQDPTKKEQLKKEQLDLMLENHDKMREGHSRMKMRH